MIFKKKLFLAGLAVILFLGAVGYRLYAHCQIPCGIYDDPARFVLLKEHVTTMEKSMKQITELSNEEHSNWNQVVRWVKNKEDHADEFTHLVTYYFMAQRIKPVDPAKEADHARYVARITMLHEMVFFAMKAKQSTDLGHIARLRSLIDGFEASYFAK